MRRWLAARPAWLLPVGLLAALLLGKLVDPLPLRQLQLAVFDSLQRLQPRAPGDPPVRVVDIDDTSLARIGQWPWPRDLVARLVDRLRQAGAAVIVLDVLFSEPDRTSPARVLEPFRGIAGLPTDLPDHDRQLAESLAKLPTIGGFAFAGQGAPTPPKLLAGFGVSGPSAREHLPHREAAITDLPEIEAVLQGYGALDSLPDIDGVVRRVPLLFDAFDRIYPSLLAETIRAMTGDKSYKVKTAGGSGEAAFGARTGLVSIRLGSGDGAVTIPTDANGALPLYFAPSNPARTIPAWRVLQDAPDPALNGVVVFIGSSATGLGDTRLTSVGFVHGTEIQAQALEQVLAGDYLARPDWADGLELCVILVAGLLLLWALPRVSPTIGALLAGALLALALGTAWYAFVSWRFQFDPVYPALCLIALYGTTTVLGFIRAEHDRAFIRNAFSRYISPALVAQLTADPSRLTLGGERRAMSFIFTDIAGFTTLSEALGPARVAKLLNPYFDELCRVILAEGGMVNEFIGDAVLALLRRADRAARPCGARGARGAGDRRLRREVSRSAECRRHSVRHHAHRRPYRHGAGRQFRRPRTLQIRCARRRGEHRFAHRGPEQAFLDARLRLAHRVRPGRRRGLSAARRGRGQGTRRGARHRRAARRGACRIRPYGALSAGLCGAGMRRGRGGDRIIPKLGRRCAGRRTGRLPSAAHGRRRPRYPHPDDREISRRAMP
ncbi:MAG: adenylate/guanylate cyclase domain-containing protein [Pseudomonadota bacterium]